MQQFLSSSEAGNSATLILIRSFITRDSGSNGIKSSSDISAGSFVFILNAS
jgi:hypothetical protein